MKIHRRNFFRTLGLATGAMALGAWTDPLSPARYSHKKNAQLTLSFSPYELQLRHAFNLANSSRTTTPVVLCQIAFDGLVGYGEASMPPYLGESHKSVQAFLAQVNLAQFTDPFRLDEILEYVDAIAPENRAAKACIDIALHDLIGKILKQPLHKLWGFSAERCPDTSFTIGLDTDEVVRQKVKEATGFKILKVKLGRGTDRQMINAIRSQTDVPLCVDVNQGWTDRAMALETTQWLATQGVVFVEQPMPKESIDDIAWLTQHSPLPIIADEAFQRLTDLKKCYGAYSGINVKLMKSTGLREAHKMILAAKALDMKVMIGCMTETSCAVSAAAQLAPLADWADLDGNLLITNDLYHGMEIHDGKVTLNNLAGIGITTL